MSIPAVASDRDHVWGAAGGQVTLVEYGDFQCPYCRDAYPIVRRLVGELDWLRSALGLDVERFDRDLRDGVYAARVEEDRRIGAAGGIPSTPRFFVDGVIHPGSPTDLDLRRAIEAVY